MMFLQNSTLTVATLNTFTVSAICLGHSPTVQALIHKAHKSKNVARTG